jgi:biotin transport system substrate-specific component
MYHHLPSTALKILLARQIPVNVCLIGSLDTSERGTVEVGDDDPGGVGGRRYGGGGPDCHPDLPGPFHASGPRSSLSGFLLGPRYAALTQAIYLLFGAIGVPVFAEFRGGLGVLLGPTGGYLLSYPIAAVAAGLAAGATRSASRSRALTVSFLWGCVGLAVIYAVGAVWLAVVTDLPLAVALAQGVLIFVPFDLIKVALAALVAIAAAPAIVPSRV